MTCAMHESGSSKKLTREVIIVNWSKMWGGLNGRASLIVGIAMLVGQRADTYN